MRAFLIAAALVVATQALAQTETPPTNPDPMSREPEPLVPEKCEQIDTWNGLKIWAGDCVSASPQETATAVSEKKLRKKKRKKKSPAVEGTDHQ
jgi:hypothetical protein